MGGSIRFGLQVDLTENWLPKALARVKTAHPEIKVEVSADRYAVLIDRLDKGQLDLALLFGPTHRSDAQRITALPMTWIGPQKTPVPFRRGEPVQLAAIKSRSGLPRLGYVDLFLHDGGHEPSKVISRFRETLLESLREHLKLAP